MFVRLPGQSVDERTVSRVDTPHTYSSTDPTICISYVRSSHLPASEVLASCSWNPESTMQLIYFCVCLSAHSAMLCSGFRHWPHSTKCHQKPILYLASLVCVGLHRPTVAWSSDSSPPSSAHPTQIMISVPHGAFREMFYQRLCNSRDCFGSLHLRCHCLR